MVWLRNRMRETRDAYEETGDDTSSSAIAELDRGMDELRDSKAELTEYARSVGDETYVIERRIALGDLGHDSCYSYTVDSWIARADHGRSCRWDSWPEVGYATVS